MGRIGRERPGQPGSRVISPARTWAAYSAVEGHQLVVGAFLDDPTVVEHHDAVGVADGRQAVGDHQRRAAAQRFVERGLHVRLVLVVEVAGGLVEDHDDRVLQQQPGDRQALLLAAAQPVAALADHRVVAVGQRGDRVVDPRARGTPRRARRSVASGLAYRRLSPIDSWNRCGSWVTTPIAARSVSCVRSRTSWPSTLTLPPVTSYSRGISPASVVLPEPEAPTSATVSPGLQRQAQPGEHVAVGVVAEQRVGRLQRCDGDLGCGRVAERHVVELDQALRVDEIDGARSIGDALRRVEHLEHPLEADHRGHQIDASVGQPGQRLVHAGDERGERDQRSAG